jgi:hypothetical protein
MLIQSGRRPCRSLLPWEETTDSNGWIDRLRRHNTVYNSLAGERRSVDSKMVITENMANNCQVLKNVTSVT